jgi:alkylhydroperoxidase/carboxymuconolactone decarboxylase family protein YurZ
MTGNPFELLMKECPTIAGAYGALVQAQAATEALDPVTKQLINIAIQTAQKNPVGVRHHARMARAVGAGREAVIGAVVMNLHLSGLGPVLTSLPAAIEGWEEADPC